MRIWANGNHAHLRNLQTLITVALANLEGCSLCLLVDEVLNILNRIACEEGVACAVDVLHNMFIHEQSGLVQDSAFAAFPRSVHLVS